MLSTPAWLIDGVDPGEWVAILSIIGIVISAVRFAWNRLIRPLSRFLDDWAGGPGRPSIPARLQAVEEAAVSADYHSRPNGGASAYDSLARKVDQISDAIAAGRSEINNVARRVDAIERKPRPTTR